MLNNDTADDLSAQGYARSEMRACAARVVNSVGFTHTSDACLEVATDVMCAYMSMLCTNVHRVSNSCGRNCSTLGDVQVAFESKDIDSSELHAYMQGMRSFPPKKLPPLFPVARVSRNRLHANAIPNASMIRLDHVPSWAPPIQRAWVRDAPQLEEAPKVDAKTLSAEASLNNPLPDFSTHSAISLGIAKVLVHDVHRRRVESEERALAKATSVSKLFAPRTQDLSTNHPKKKVSKRKSSESHSSMPPEEDVKPSISALDQRAAATESFVQPAKPPPPMIQETPLRPIGGQRIKGEPVLASDLLFDATTSVASLSKEDWESEVVAPTTSTINDPPQPHHDPARAVQLAILRSLFSLDKEMKEEVNAALECMRNRPIESVIEVKEEPAPAVDAEPVYQVVAPPPILATPEVSGERVLPPLRLKINRSIGEAATETPSPLPTNADGYSSGSENASDAEKIRKRHRRKKRKKRNKERYEALHVDVDMDDAAACQPSPVETKIETDGKIKLKIRFGAFSRPESRDPPQ